MALYAAETLDGNAGDLRTGFSVRWAGANDPTSAIAVPVGRGDELVGSLVCSTYAKSLTQRRIDELVPEIRAVAEEVLAIWRQCNPNSGAAAAVPLPARRSAQYKRAQRRSRRMPGSGRAPSPCEHCSAPRNNPSGLLSRPRRMCDVGGAASSGCGFQGDFR